LYSENQNCDRKWSEFQTLPNTTTCLACLQAHNQPQMKVTLPASGLQEKTMRSRRGPGTKPAGKHNHHHSPYHSPPISSLYFCTGRGAVALHHPSPPSCSPKLGHSSSILVVLAQTHSAPCVAQTHNPTTLHAPPPHPYTMSPIAVPLSLFFNLLVIGLVL
jgi:hypothetical protein